MIYLKEFVLPKDEWVDFYFTPAFYCPDLPENMPVAHNSTAVNSWYPWNTLYGRGLRNFIFDDITIFYGGNGSGKTTLLNIIAQTLKLSRTSRYNRSSFFDDYTTVCEPRLQTTDCQSAIQRGKIVTSDDVFKNMLQIREDNDSGDIRRDILYHEFFELSGRPLPKKNLTDSKVLAEYKLLRKLQKESFSCSKYIKSKMEMNKKEYSNGETAFQYFVDAIKDESLVLLDEPENSLSAKWQIELSKYLAGASRAFNCQLIIATHSPFILSTPGVKIYNLDAFPITTSKWYELENIIYYYELFKDNEVYFK